MTFEPKSEPVALPVIALDDYEAFRTILKTHIPDTFDEWLDKFAKWEKEFQSRGIVRINAYPAEFSRYLDTTGAIPNLRSLIDFAGHVADKHNVKPTGPIV